MSTLNEECPSRICSLATLPKTCEYFSRASWHGCYIPTRKPVWHQSYWKTVVCFSKPASLSTPRRNRRHSDVVFRKWFADILWHSCQACFRAGVENLCHVMKMCHFFLLEASRAIGTCRKTFELEFPWSLFNITLCRNWFARYDRQLVNVHRQKRPPPRGESCIFRQILHPERKGLFHTNSLRMSENRMNDIEL